MSFAVSVTGKLHSSKLCNYIKFPNHRYRRHRQECGTLLLETVELSTGRKILLLGLQCGMQCNTEQWRMRENHDGLYDGKVWSDFRTVDGQPFL